MEVVADTYEPPMTSQVMDLEEQDLAVPDDDTAEFAVAMTAALKTPVCEKGMPGAEDASTSMDGISSKKTLNRRQRRTIHQGIQRGLQLHEKIFEVLDQNMPSSPDPSHTWTLMEVFAGKARLSAKARKRSPRWHVLPEQDLLYGLDLLNPEHVEIFKDVVRAQKPDVITVSPPCGPWSSWQRMRKRKSVLRELRRKHLPFWNLVAWLWDFQNSTGGLVILEQPASSEALQLPVMARRKHVHQKVVHLCKINGSEGQEIQETPQEAYGGTDESSCHYD